MKHVFRANDIRGKVETELTDTFAYGLGRAFASFLRTKGVPAANVALGWDPRHSSPGFAAVFGQGVQDEGGVIHSLGMVPSPVVYFAKPHLGCHGAVVVTGSHNPSTDNGFKLMGPNGALMGDDILSLYEHYLPFENSQLPQEMAPTATIHQETLSAYLENIRNSLAFGSIRPRIIFDTGNGAAGPLLKQAVTSLPIEGEFLFAKPDGEFPNHHPDPTLPETLETLRDRVLKTNASAGIALDGDGDRIGVIDETGEILWGDQLTLLFAQELLKESPGATIIGEVKCSQTLFDGVREAGGNPVMWKVGHGFIKQKMQQSGALLAGEMSGHLFFADRYGGFDDGLYAALRVAEWLSHGHELSPWRKTLPSTVASPEIRLDCPDAIKTKVVQETAIQLQKNPGILDVINIDGIRAHFANGWGLVRASNTQPVLVLRAEGTNSEALTRIKCLIEDETKRQIARASSV